MLDSTPERPSQRVVLYRVLLRDLWGNPMNRPAQDAVARAERDLTEADWRWVRGEWNAR